MPKVLTARGGKAPFEFIDTLEKLFGEDFSVTIVSEIEGADVSNVTMEFTKVSYGS